MEEAPTRNRDAVESARISSGRVSIGPKRSCRARPGGAAQHSIWGFPLIVASSYLGLEGEVLAKRQQHALLVATLEQLEPRSQAQSGPQPRPRHRQVLRYLHEQASRRLGEKERDE